MKYFLLCFFISIYAMEHEKKLEYPPPHPFLMTIAQSRFPNLLSPEMQQHTTEASFKEKVLRTFLLCLSTNKKAQFEEFFRGRKEISFPDGPTVSRTFEDPILYISVEQTLYEAFEKGKHTYWIETESESHDKHLFKLSVILSWIKQGEFTDPLNCKKIIAAKIWEIKNSFFITRRQDLETQFMSPTRFKYKFFQSHLEPSIQQKNPSIRQRSRRRLQEDPFSTFYLRSTRREIRFHPAPFSVFDQPDASHSRYSTGTPHQTRFRPPYPSPYSPFDSPFDQPPFSVFDQPDASHSRYSTGTPHQTRFRPPYPSPYSPFDSPFDQPPFSVFDQPDASHSRYSTGTPHQTRFRPPYPSPYSPFDSPFDQPPYSPFDSAYLSPPTFSRYSRW